MFAKSIHASGNTRLKGKDVKKLRVDLLRMCAIDSEIAWNILGKDAVVKIKLAAPSRTVLYTDTDSNVVAFDLNGKGDVIPSTYLLWFEQELRERLPKLIVHSPVSHYLLRGADPMLPGVVKRVDTPFAKGQIRAVYVNGNPMPFAVGEMNIDMDYIASHGWKGKAMQLYHIFGDELTKLNSNQKKFIPDGFSDTIIEPLEAVPDSDNETQVEAITLEVNKTSLIDNENEEKAPPQQEIPITTEELDSLLERSFYQAMKKVKPSDAPMLGNLFYGNYVLPNRPLGSTINLKQTTYKKFSIFLKAMDTHGVIEVKEHDGVQTIILFRKTHPDVARHTLHRSEQDEIDAATAEATAGIFVPGQYAPQVHQLYRLTQQTQILFPSATIKDTFTLAQIREQLNAHVASHALVDPKEEQYVKMDPILTDALFKGKKKPDNGYPVKIARKDILNLLVERLRGYHSVQLYPDQDCREVAGNFKPLLIKTELSKRQKPVTIVSNFM
ncbi:ligatin, partial [Thraustotheca clavata]